MTVEALQWLIGISLTTVLAIAGIATGAFRSMASRLDSAVDRLSSSIKDGDEKLASAMKHEDDRLHERVNRVKDEYVPRRELDDHLKRFDDSLKEIRQDQKSILRMLAERSSS